MKLDTSGWKLPRDIKLADEHFNEPGSIDLLLGAELFYEIMQSGRYTRPNHPVLQETTLGWTVAGNTPIITATTKAQHAFPLRDNPLEKNLNRFWEIEPMEQSTMPRRQKACVKPRHTHNSTKERRGVNRRPTKLDPTYLANSHLAVERRASTIDTRFGRGPKLKVQDHNFMRKREDIRHKKSVRFQEGNKAHCSLPHHPGSLETGSTRRTLIASGGILKPSCIQQQFQNWNSLQLHC
jgi:hypothetical protein